MKFWQVFIAFLVACLALLSMVTASPQRYGGYRGGGYRGGGGYYRGGGYRGGGYRGGGYRGGYRG
ncbi:acanthoscurrin-1-like isoform X1 [Diaphorina citri]|uniref:Acanthoscurrin-1-like isoform X1 n=1 Tax=Diaphorina citri TaxID=121845 RepID=A0A1S3DCL8_DIACI|nr:acanthoscurrin-1-like isoform X1 [Diaphorina citri]XP_008479163.1 acanthoscurrin-1-like isoform X2 [Diaphorina citri]XP_008479165.1 acanthoscurrin-1-like isoform X1 [Diaphorina citri]XP_026684312.1 acanthoscurrin-1-like isoform X1 [Diaphorina citri]